MKTFISVLFIVGAVIGALTNHYEASIVGTVGLLLTNASLKPEAYAFLNIVPGKFVVPSTAPGSGYQEVPYMSRSEKALFDQLITLNRANPVTQNVIAQGGVSFDPITYYIRANITGGAGIQQIVNNSSIQIAGITNIPNGGSLPQFYNFCFDRIAVRYAQADTADAPVQSITGFSSIRGSMPAALGNGHLIIRSNSNKILETPVADFTSVAAITGGGERDYDGGAMEKPRFFLELINIEVELQYAQGQLVPSEVDTTNAVEVMFYGVQARLKA